jgi:hypothetical protein
MRTRMAIQTHTDEQHHQQPTNRKSGRAVSGENGSTVWEWQTATGVFERHISDEKLLELTSPQLEFAEDSTLAPRKYEGLWIHDAHRPIRSVAAPRLRPKPRPSPHPLRDLLRKLSGT